MLISGDNTIEYAGAHYTLGHIFLEDNVNIYIAVSSIGWVAGFDQRGIRGSSLALSTTKNLSHTIY